MSFKCHICGKKFASEQSLQSHVNKKTKCNTLKCHNCKCVFPNKLAFVLHQSVCETKDKERLMRHKHYELCVTESQLITEIDYRGNIKYVTSNCLNILGYTQDELINTSTYDIVFHHDPQKKNLNNSESIIKYRKNHKNGQQIWFESSSPKHVFDDVLVCIETCIKPSFEMETQFMIGDFFKCHQDDNYVFQCTEEGMLRYANESFTDLLNLEDYFSLNIKEFFYKEFSLSTGTRLCEFKFGKKVMPIKCSLKYYEKYRSFIGIFKKHTVKKNELFRSFVHELRNPVNSLLQGIEYGSKFSNENVSTKNRKILYMNQKTSVELIKNLLNDFLDFEKMSV